MKQSHQPGYPEAKKRSILGISHDCGQQMVSWMPPSILCIGSSITKKSKRNSSNSRRSCSRRIKATRRLSMHSSTCFVISCFIALLSSSTSHMSQVPSPSCSIIFSMLVILFVLQPPLAMSKVVVPNSSTSIIDSKSDKDSFSIGGGGGWVDEITNNMRMTWSKSSSRRRRSHNHADDNDDFVHSQHSNISVDKSPNNDVAVPPAAAAVVVVRNGGDSPKPPLLKWNGSTNGDNSITSWNQKYAHTAHRHFETMSKSFQTNVTTTSTTTATNLPNVRDGVGVFDVEKKGNYNGDIGRMERRGEKGITNRNYGIVASSVYNTKLPISLQRQMDRRLGSGRITCDFGTRHAPYDINTDMTLAQASEQNHGMHNRMGTKIRVSVDPQAFGRLVPIVFVSCTTFLSAFMATLRLLAPLVISKRILCSIGNLISDWYTGRYFRTTYTRLEKLYIHYYETPATFRALLRTISQWCIYLLLGKLMGYLVGITHKPCRSEGRGLALTCGLLWVGSVVGTGHAFAEAVARWGGPLRLQAVKHIPKRRLMHVFTKPWHILHWMQNPEQWIDMIAEPERRPFDPNPVLFPVTWIPLRLLQMVAVAKVVSTDPKDYLWCPVDEGDQVPKVFGKFLLQLALCDEWYRVFIREKRVGLGIAVMILYCFAMVSLLVSSAMLNGRATLLMVPSLVAIIVS
eukprot:CAMPEP_0176481450 /NCGR_PEP_ID=MMETSP0200_2-20121128/2826_1 /TAXON_ID=947934 /ORGANISM="Chaetoceros sp., Strain GSL56" /LENGTH=683 /DNA_ID=CAMNT_0017877655 /DNA_START=266 /DNA_END=2313 /DNA_ORIENTATION=-